MDEFKFAVKSLISTILLLLVLQIKVGHAPIESYVQDWTQNSAVTKYLQKVAAGGALALKNTSKSVAEFSSQVFGNSETQKASRLNIEFKRSPSVEQKENMQN